MSWQIVSSFCSHWGKNNTNRLNFSRSNWKLKFNVFVFLEIWNKLENDIVEKFNDMDDSINKLRFKIETADTEVTSVRSNSMKYFEETRGDVDRTNGLMHFIENRVLKLEQANCSAQIQTEKRRTDILTEIVKKLENADFGRRISAEKLRINQIGEKVGQISENDISGLQSSVSDMNADIQEFVNDFSMLSLKIAVLEQKVSNLATADGELKEESEGE